MMRMLLISTATLLLLASCSSPDPGMPFLSPSAGPCIRYIECEDGLAGCHEEAREVCNGGYSQVDETTLGSGFGDFARDHFPGAAAGVPHMVVTCTNPD